MEARSGRRINAFRSFFYIVVNPLSLFDRGYIIFATALQKTAYNARILSDGGTMPTEYTGPEFFKALKDGSLSKRETIVRQGMVKPDDKAKDMILFNAGLDCAEWIPIPIRMIEKVEHHGNVSCEDHQHPHVRLHLKTPVSNPEAEVFSRMLNSTGPSLKPFTGRIGTGPSTVTKPATTPTAMAYKRFQDSYGNWFHETCGPWENTGQTTCDGVNLWCIMSRVCTLRSGYQFAIGQGIQESVEYDLQICGSCSSSGHPWSL